MKTAKIVSIVVWSVVALLLTALLIVGIAADFRLGSFSIGFSGLRYDNAEAYSVGDALLPADNIQQVEINWTSGSVRVEAYDGEKISIKETGAENEEQKLRYLSRDGKLTIQYCKSRAFFGIFKNPEKELTLLVPAQMAEDLKTFKIDSASTKINISDIASQEFEIETVSGDCKFTNIQTAVVNLDAVSADIEMSGSIGGLDIDITSGTCTIDNDVMPYEIDYDGVSGDFTMTMPEGSGFNLKHDKVSGDFFCEFPTSHESGRYIYGDGSANYNFDTVSGNVTLNRKQPSISE